MKDNLLHTKDKSLRWFGPAFGGLAVLLVFGLWLHHRQSENNTRQASSVIDLNPQMSDQEFGAGQAQMGFMTQPEGTRWSQIAQIVKQRGSITPSELNWTLQGLAQPPPSLPPNIPLYFAPRIAATRHLEFMLLLREAKNYSPAQEERIYQATEGYLSAPEPNDKAGALAVMRTLKDSRAIPKVKTLLNDPDGVVRASAQKTLEALSRTQ